MPWATCMASSSLRPPVTRLDALTGVNGDEANWWTDGLAASAESWSTVAWWPSDCRAPTVWALAARVSVDGRVPGRPRPLCPPPRSTAAAAGGASAEAGRVCSSAVLGCRCGRRLAVAMGSTRANRRLLGAGRTFGVDEVGGDAADGLAAGGVHQIDPDRVHPGRVEAALLGHRGQVDGEATGRGRGAGVIDHHRQREVVDPAGHRRQPAEREGVGGGGDGVSLGRRRHRLVEGRDAGQAGVDGDRHPELGGRRGPGARVSNLRAKGWSLGTQGVCATRVRGAAGAGITAAVVGERAGVCAPAVAGTSTDRARRATMPTTRPHRTPASPDHARTSVGCRWGMGCLVPDPLRTAAYASRTTLGGVFPERLQPLVEATAELSDRFRSAGHSLYLVGGSVRDAIVAEGGHRRGRRDGGTSTSPPTPGPMPSRRW